jgi:hypothetical protein
VAIVSLNVANVPVRDVHVENPGPGARAQLYEGPDDAGVPVVALAVFEILTISPAQTFDPPIVPALWVTE